MAKKIINLFIYRAIDLLLRWADNHQNRAFFIILCDKHLTHVAFQNIDKVSCDAAVMIGADPELAAAWENIGIGVEFTSKDCYQDPKWLEAANQLPFDSTSFRWKYMNYKSHKNGELCK